MLYCNKHILFVEGFLIYNIDTKIETEFDLKFFLQAGRELMSSRRSQRLYQTENGPEKDPQGYFENYVWKSYEQYYGNLTTLSKKNITILDANQNKQELSKIVLMKMKQSNLL